MKKKLISIISIVGLVVIGFWCFKIFHHQFPTLQTTQTLPTLSTTQKPLFSFSVIGDPESDLPNLKKALEISKNNGDEFTVLVGDLTHVGSKKELGEVKQVLEESGLKYYAVPGNHDVYSAKKLTGNPTEYFLEIIGSPYGEVPEHKGVTMLLIDNSDEDKGISAKQMEFIRQSLTPGQTASNAAAVFIFMHIPIYHPDSTYLMGYNNEDVSKQKDVLLSLLKTASVSAIFSGHLHHTSSYENRGLKYYVAGSASSQRNWQTPRFLEVEIFDNGKFKVNEVEIN